MLPNFKPSVCLVLGASLLLSACALAPAQQVEPSAQITLADFTTDGCSMFPDGTSAQPKLWCQCCVEHDKAYWAGGTESKRREADLVLKECVRALGQSKTAAIIWAGVRIGGSPYLPTPFRWSYGWPYTRGYRALDSSEMALAHEKWLRYGRKEINKNSVQAVTETAADICDVPAIKVKE